MPSSPHLLTTLHSEDWHTPKGRFIREVMFGMNDGLISTIGFVAGATGALMQTRLVLLTGIASVVAGALAMGIGAYLASKSQRDFFESEKERERREIEEVPELERKEIRDIFTKLGFLKDEVEMIVNRVTSDKALWVRFMMREELGILEESFDNPVTVGFLMSGAYVVGGIAPLLPYLVMEDVLMALKVAVAVSLVALFIIGVGKTVLTKQPWLKSGMEVMLLGSLAAGVGFGIGKLVAVLWPEVGAVGIGGCDNSGWRGGEGEGREMNRLNALIAGCLMAVLAAQPAFAAVDREKLLTEPGVFGTFAVFKVDDSWWKLDKAARTFAATEVKAVFQKHGDNIITDTYLLRGLTGKADFFVRVHSTEMLHNQNFLVDLMGTRLGTRGSGNTW